MSQGILIPQPSESTIQKFLCYLQIDNPEPFIKISENMQIEDLNKITKPIWLFTLRKYDAEREYSRITFCDILAESR